MTLARSSNSNSNSNSNPTPAKIVVSRLAQAGITHATGVPCSLLAALFAEVESESTPLTYVPAPREDTAVGIASGLAVAGSIAVVMMQNSGLGYCLNVITSFTLIYDVHLPMIVSWRGRNGDDAVEHDVIGRTLTSLLDVFEIPWVLFDSADPDGSMDTFLSRYDNGRSTCVLVVDDGMSK